MKNEGSAGRHEESRRMFLRKVFVETFPKMDKTEFYLQSFSGSFAVRTISRRAGVNSALLRMTNEVIMAGNGEGLLRLRLAIYRN